MKLIDDWDKVLKRAWSIRWILMAGFFSGLEIIVPMFEGAIPRGVFAGLSFVAANGAFVTRILAQKEPSDGADQ